MLATPMDVLRLFPVRKTKVQKQAFRDAVLSYTEELGYSGKVEQGKYGCQNLILGDPERAEYLITAHYDTPPRLLVPNAIAPCNLLHFAFKELLGILAMFLLAFLGGLIYLLLTKDTEFVWLVCLAATWLYLILIRIGPANPANANDNTSGVVTLLEIARTLPENQRHKVCFVLFDLEEAGLIGSGSYRRAHKAATEKQIVFNLDCVGDGDEIRFFPSKKLRKDPKKINWLWKGCQYLGKKSLLLHEKGFAIYPSDQMNFPLSVGIGAFRRKKRLGLYMDKIHTPKDIYLDETNVNILRASLTTLVSCDAVK